MSVDCDPVSGYGFEITDAMFDKLRTFSKNSAELGSDIESEDFGTSEKRDLLEELGLVYSEAGSYYSGDVYFYSLVSPKIYTELPSAIETLKNDWKKYSIEITEDMIKFESETLWC